MATDPIRRIREREHDVPVTFGIREALGKLAQLPPSLDVPYLSASLDWTPAGEDPGREPPPELRRSEARARRGEAGASRRPGRREFEREIQRILADCAPRGARFESLSGDSERIAAFLDDELDPAGQGIFIVACSARGVFEHFVFALPLRTRVTVAPVPELSSLAWLVDDHPAYAVLLADQHQATLSKIRRAARGRSVRLESSDWPRRQQTGGLSQKRLQARADERVAAFARGIANETERTLDEADVDMLVIASDPVIGSALSAAFSQRVTDRIVGAVTLDIQASEEEVIAATQPLVERIERDQELAAVRAVVAGAAGDGMAAAGATVVLQALQIGQVATLVIADDFTGTGWADYGRDVYGVGAIPAAHPAGGELPDITRVDLDEEMIRLAVRTGAEIEIVHTSVPFDQSAEGTIPPAGSPPPRSEAAALLDECGGVGALLRYTVT